MAKTDWKAEAKALKKKVRKLKDSLTSAAGPVARR
jgi:glutamate N-acetyltransferase / amino-acid N-acetyltransferase